MPIWQSGLRSVAQGFERDDRRQDGPGRVAEGGRLERVPAPVLVVGLEDGAALEAARIGARR